MAEGLGKEEAYRKAYQNHAKQKFANAVSLPVQEIIKLEERARRLGLKVDSSVNRKKNPEAKTPDSEQRDKSGRETELFLPDEYYEKLNKDIHREYQAPNTKEVYRRLGNTSNEIETSIVISDEFGRIRYRIDYSTHGRDLSHTNPHIHEFVGSTGKGDYHISELRYFIDESTGKMRPGKANNDGTYRWLDTEE